MKELFYKISTVLMAIIVLFSTVSFTVDMHYCGDTLVDLAVFKEAKSCEMEEMQLPQNFDNTVKKKSCCTDRQIIFEGQDNLKDTPVKLSFQQQAFIISYTYSYLYLFEDSNTVFTSFIGHPPPLLDKDYQVLYETFLI